MKNDYERTYTEMASKDTYLERFEYLRIPGTVASETFGFERYLNQVFYRSPEWKQIRNEIIIRDNGCDLGIEGREIGDKIFIHHINPITPFDLRNRTYKLYDPENLVCVSKRTHDALHYGDESILISDPVPRSANDTCPWR